MAAHPGSHLHSHSLPVLHSRKASLLDVSQPSQPTPSSSNQAGRYSKKKQELTSSKKQQKTQDPNSKQTRELRQLVSPSALIAGHPSVPKKLGDGDDASCQQCHPEAAAFPLVLLSSRTLRRMLLFLNLPDTLAFGSVCRRFAKLCHDPELWRRKYRTDFGSALRLRLEREGGPVADWRRAYEQQLKEARRRRLRAVTRGLSFLSLLGGRPFDTQSSSDAHLSPDLITPSSSSPPSSSSSSTSNLSASASSHASASASAPAPKRPAVSFAAAALAAQFGAKLRRRARDSNADSSPSRAAVATPRSLQTPFSFVDKSQALTQKEKKRAPARLFRPKSAPPLASLAIVFAIALGLLGVLYMLEWDSTPGSHEVAPFRTIAAGSGVVELSGSKLTVSLSHHADPRDDRFCNDFEIVDGKGEVLGHIVRSEQGSSYGFHLLDTQLRLNASMTGSAALLRNEVEFVVKDANGTFLAKIDEHWRPGFFLSEYWVELKDQRNSVFAFISKGDADRNEMDFLTEESMPPLFHMRRSITHFLIFSKSEYRWEIQRVGQQRVVDPRITALFAAKLIATNLIDEDHDDDDSTMSSQTHVDDDLDILPSADQVDDWDM